MKRPVRWRVTMRRPRLAGQICIVRLYLSMGVSPEEVSAFAGRERLEFLARNGVKVSRMVAHTLCRGPVSRRLLVRPVAWFLREAVEHRFLLGALEKFISLMGERVFYEYYQLDRSGEPDEVENEPKKEGELRTEFEGSHSPFGFIWNIASATGWTVEYILEKVNYQTLILMLSDAPRYVRRSAADSGSAKRWRWD